MPRRSKASLQASNRARDESGRFIPWYSRNPNFPYDTRNVDPVEVASVSSGFNGNDFDSDVSLGDDAQSETPLSEWGYRIGGTTYYTPFPEGRNHELHTFLGGGDAILPLLRRCGDSAKRILPDVNKLRRKKELLQAKYDEALTQRNTARNRPAAQRAIGRRNAGQQAPAGAQRRGAAPARTNEEREADRAQREADGRAAARRRIEMKRKIDEMDEELKRSETKYLDDCGPFRKAIRKFERNVKDTSESGLEFLERPQTEADVEIYPTYEDLLNEYVNRDLLNEMNRDG